MTLLYSESFCHLGHPWHSPIDACISAFGVFLYSLLSEVWYCGDVCECLSQPSPLHPSSFRELIPTCVYVLRFDFCSHVPEDRQTDIQSPWKKNERKENISVILLILYNRCFFGRFSMEVPNWFCGIYCPNRNYH